MLAGRWLAGKSGSPFTIERRDVDALEDRIATALSARDRLLAEAKDGGVK